MYTCLTPTDTTKTLDYILWTADNPSRRYKINTFNHRKNLHSTALGASHRVVKAEIEAESVRQTLAGCSNWLLISAESEGYCFVERSLKMS